MGTEGIRELYEYEDSLKNFRDMYSVISTAEQKGLNRGRAEGRAEGIKENASKMKAMNFAVDVISQVTGLSTEEIENL